MAIPNRYITTSQTLVNYNYVDIINGTGYSVYYLCKGADSYFLTTNSNVVSDYHTSLPLILGTVAFSKSVDEDYDILFNAPRTIKGTAIINIPLAMNYAAGGADIVMKALIRIRKWDGSTETEIANNETSEFASDVTASKIKIVEISIPETNFKQGEYLRVTIEIWQKQIGRAHV